MRRHRRTGVDVQGLYVCRSSKDKLKQQQQLQLAAPYAARLVVDQGTNAKMFRTDVDVQGLCVCRSSKDKMKQQLHLAAPYAARLVVEEGADGGPAAVVHHAMANSRLGHAEFPPGVANGVLSWF